jgi:primosomal protein N'
LEDDKEWIQCLEEASAMQTGSQLHSLFVTILIGANPTKPKDLWDCFCIHICDDLHYKLLQKGIPDPSQEQVYNYGLYLMQDLLGAQGSSLENFPPMSLSQIAWTHLSKNCLIMEQRNYDQAHQQLMADEHIHTLNPDQHSAFDQIMDTVNSHSGCCFFLHGPGGTGKTYVYNTLCYALQAKGTIVLCVASSGIAALILMGGHTSHSRLRIPIAVNEDSFCNIKRGSLEAELIQETSLLIYDEVIMQH